MTLQAFSFCSIFLEPQKGQFLTNPFVYSSTVPQTSNSFRQLSQTKSYAGIACYLQSLCVHESLATLVRNAYKQSVFRSHLCKMRPVISPTRVAFR